MSATTMLRASPTVAQLARLYAGLIGFGISLAMMVRAGLGLGPWDVLHQGIARRLGVQIGWVTIAASVLVLLAWIPLRQRPGLGTLSNVVLVGLAVNATLDVLPGAHPLSTVIYALSIGPLVHLLLPRLSMRRESRC